MTPQNLRSRIDFMVNAWDWGFLNECFYPSKIRFSDIDGVAEFNDGAFIFLEAKPRGKYVEPTSGQGILFTHLAAIPRATVIILYGETSRTEEMQVWPNPPEYATNEDVQRMVSYLYHNV